MRVIAGTARSLPLKTPDGLDTRPTTDRIKETLFNMLQTDIPGCTFIDLFNSEYFSETDFQDYDHLNSNGAKKLSKIIAEAIGGE